MKQKQQRTSNEYAAFEGLLRQVIQVSHSEIKAKIDAEKAEKKRKGVKPLVSSRASSEKD